MSQLDYRRRRRTCSLASPFGRGSELSSGEGLSLRQHGFPHSLDSSRPLPEGEEKYGFTLLEIILALAILAGSLAALGEVMRLADQNASMTRDESQAQILASSVMDELVAGARDLVAIDRGPFDFVTEPPWVYSVVIEPTAYEELVAVRVLVEQDIDPRLQPARFALVRWMPNPDYIPTTTSSSSTGSSSTGSSQSGGTSAQSGTGGQR
jgi:general secretion pathway protein I